MNTPNFASLLTALRAFVLKSRPAYKDYLGTESVEEKTVLISGKLSADGESVNAKDAFKGFVEGETCKVTVGDETVDATAQYGTGSFSGCIVIGSSNVMPSNEIPGWMICVYNENLLGYGAGEWVGKSVEVFTERTVKVDRWDVKKLAYELLPDRLLSALSAAANTARKALTAADAAQSTADAAQSTADAAQSTAAAAQSTAAAAQSTAAAAQSTAAAAQSTAAAAQSTAAAAQSTAAAAQSTAAAAQSTLENVTAKVQAEISFTFDKQISGRDSFTFNSFNYYKISRFSPAPADVINFSGTRANGADYSTIEVGKNSCGYGLFVVVTKAGTCSLPITSTVSGSFTAPSTGLYAQFEDGNDVITAGSAEFEYIKRDLIVTSPTYKKFKITVDDTGTLSATEVTDSTT